MLKFLTGRVFTNDLGAINIKKEADTMSTSFVFEVFFS